MTARPALATTRVCVHPRTPFPDLPMLRRTIVRLTVLFALASGTGTAAERPWDGVVVIDPRHSHHFARTDGERVFVFNKTAWHFFSAARPEVTLARCRRLGANVIRVALETRLYHNVLGIDAWPWGGTREAPDFATFDEDYWREVDRRIELAAAAGIGINLTLFTSLHLPDEPASYERMRPYLDRVIARLARHPNIFCWEVHNEHVANPGFQEAVGRHLQANDPHRRPVISSNGTTDYPLWPHAAWMDLALVHHCTGNQPQYDLRDWYLAIARNLRVHGKPAFNNETGREVRHRNDDPVHRRKQLWIAAAAGGYTTWHSWDGCEGIDDDRYEAPGEGYAARFAHWWRQQEFWRVDPAFTVGQLAPGDPLEGELVPVVLTSDARDLTLAYLFTRGSGTTVTDGRLRLRLPAGDYRVEFFSPADGRRLGEPVVFQARHLRFQDTLPLPPFTDDLAFRAVRTLTRDQTAIPGTH